MREDLLEAAVADGFRVDGEVYVMLRDVALLRALPQPEPLAREATVLCREEQPSCTGCGRPGTALGQLVKGKNGRGKAFASLSLQLVVQGTVANAGNDRYVSALRVCALEWLAVLHYRREDAQLSGGSFGKGPTTRE